jgi:signal transduction histidine kinase/ActR/RegA family two-component response regulator
MAMSDFEEVGPSSVVDSTHVVQFYEDEGFLCETLTDFSSEGLTRDESVILVATEPHLREIERRLNERDIDVGKAQESDRLVLLGARQTLETLSVDGTPDEDRFLAGIPALLATAIAAGRRVRIFGEMVDLLWRAGYHGAAIRLEEMWKIYPKANFSRILCGYSMDNFVSESHTAEFERICQAHTAVRPAERYQEAHDPSVRMREVARLQQRARALESEVTRRHQVEVALRQSLEREQSAHQSKDQFLAMLGHELRNPLSVIAVSLRVMEHRLGDQVVAERGRIDRQLKLLVRLVDDLLDTARLAYGKVELKKEPSELAEIVASALEVAGPLIAKKRHMVTVSVATEGLVIDGDRQRLAQVVGNLVTNAAKYTAEGGTIRITGTSADDKVVLRVEDNGVGIAPDLLPRMFDAFVQGDRGLDRSEGGLGLGLAVAQKLIALHGGTIAASSDGPGTGSAFTISLPRIAGPSRGAAPPAAIPAPLKAPANPLKVLVVDDNVDAARVVGDWVRLRGHDVVVVHDAVAAIGALAEIEADVGLVDIGLPGMDGYALARSIRARTKANRMFLVALTGYSEDSHRARSRDAGFDAHLVKPIDLESLQDLLKGVRSGADAEF